MDIESRRLQHGKLNKVKIHRATPKSTEGVNGDMRITLSGGKLKLYIKASGGWYSTLLNKEAG